ncbi:MAG: hypothetical protein KA735_10075 [Burkholderiaceae bacterium]|nr:hypothetical protein [Burkholderiaceae bacterium]
MTDDIVTDQGLDALARYADLPLNSARKQAVLPILQAWVPAANALSERMARDEVRDQLPGTIFTLGARR